MKTIQQELQIFIKDLPEETAHGFLVGFRIACLNLEQEAVYRMIELDPESARKFIAKRTFNEIFKRGI